MGDFEDDIVGASIWRELWSGQAPERGRGPLEESPGRIAHAIRCGPGSWYWPGSRSKAREASEAEPA